MILDFIDSEILELFFEDEYQKLIHRCENSYSTVTDKNLEYLLLGLKFYGEAADEWEKSYNYTKIQRSIAKSIECFDKITSSEEAEILAIESLKLISRLISIGVTIENGLLANDSKIIHNHAVEAYTLVGEMMEKIGEDAVGVLSEFYEYLKDYYHFHYAQSLYAELIGLMKQPDEFLRMYDIKHKEILEQIMELKELESIINLTELEAMMLSLKRIKKLIENPYPSISIPDSYHKLSISFYTGGDLANSLIRTYNGESPDMLSHDLFKGEIDISSLGVDILDDFLQTSIGKKFGDQLHLGLNEGNIRALGYTLTFDTDVYIRKFGVCTVVFTIKMEDQPLTVSDLRTLQTLVGPQCGTGDIKWNNKEFLRLVDIVKSIHNYFLEYEKVRRAKTETLRDFYMENVPFEPERTWYSVGFIRELGVTDNQGYKRIYDYHEVEDNPEFQALVLPLYEGRITLHDWITIPEKPWVNLANIRSHKGDMIYTSAHTFTAFMPENAEFMNQSLLSAVSLVNDINALIIAFDVMAEKVRSGLIIQVHESKKALESAEINKINKNLELIRRRQIELTEFELVALQSIQLLKSQESLLYTDHSEFMKAMIENSSMDDTIDNLEGKLRIIKESQEGILRTADDLVARYQQKVSESQQRLIKVVTLIAASFGQISLIGGILDSLKIRDDNLKQNIEFGVTVFALLLAITAIGWLVFSFLNSRSNIFNFDRDTEE
ncbi:MAG: hypothetical protein INQ03_22790 [Candidatus Heimdallarchaeota archaeon]|nr:hypothetical protein [Candidatus Heimdallarchaeota archaeon]